MEVDVKKQDEASKARPRMPIELPPPILPGTRAEAAKEQKNKAQPPTPSSNSGKPPCPLSSPPNTLPVTPNPAGTQKIHPGHAVSPKPTPVTAPPPTPVGQKGPSYGDGFEPTRINKGKSGKPSAPKPSASPTTNGGDGYFIVLFISVAIFVGIIATLVNTSPSQKSESNPPATLAADVSASPEFNSTQSTATPAPTPTPTPISTPAPSSTPKPQLGADEYFDQGYSYGEEGRFGLSVFAYKQAIRLNGNFATAWNNLGWTYKKVGNIVSAIDAYKHAAEIYARLGKISERDDAIKKWQALENIGHNENNLTHQSPLQSGSAQQPDARSKRLSMRPNSNFLGNAGNTGPSGDNKGASKPVAKASALNKAGERFTWQNKTYYIKEGHCKELNKKLSKIRNLEEKINGKTMEIATENKKFYEGHKNSRSDRERIGKRLYSLEADRKKMASERDSLQAEFLAFLSLARIP